MARLVEAPATEGPVTDMPEPKRPARHTSTLRRGSGGAQIHPSRIAETGAQAVCRNGIN